MVKLLDRLEAVREVGRGRWVARCPAHEDRRPSLSVREADDGRVLVYCFAGCGACDVVSAVGLDLRDLFPPRDSWAPTTGSSPTRIGRKPPPVPASDALALLDQEALVVMIIACRLAQGDSVEQHAANLGLAANRIGAIRSAWRMRP